MPMARSSVASNSSTNGTYPPPNSQSSTTNRQTAPVRRDTHMATTEYARKCKILMELNLDLERLGANTYFDLPKIVVSGGQSAGKSSLVEAVTGISVPRDSGTCTRCSMECTMFSGAESWSCIITLHIDYDDLGNKLEQPKKEMFGSRITDKSKVELWLRRAQVAILSPHRQPNEFLGKSESELKAMYADADQDLRPFSFNSIHLQVEDPDATNLSFVDLPGLIQHHDNREMIQLVKQLVEGSMKGKNTIIVVTIPMTDDIENQQAFLLASEEDPSGERTIGVGTKPDMLPPGSTGLIQKWKDILEGRANLLKHGYYCVKLPNDVERSEGLRRAEASKREAQFFTSTEPWKTIADRSRLGISNFVSSISKLLVRLIEMNLPHLREVVETQLKLCRDELEEMPAVIDSDAPLIQILARVSNFRKAFDNAVHGNQDKDFVQQNRQTYRAFKQAIQQTAPNFKPYGHSVNKLSLMGPISQRDVRKLIDESITWEFPHYIPFEVTKQLVLKHLAHWEGPALSCFHEVCNNVSERIDKLIKRQDYFGQFEELQHFVRQSIKEDEEDCQQDALTTLKKVVDREAIGPLFTENTEAFEAEKNRWKQRHTVGNIARRYADHGVSEESDHEEIHVMADVEAYFQVASKRFIDDVPLTIEHEVIQNLSSRLEKKLFKALYDVGIDDPDRLREFLKEDASLAARRKVLNGRVSQLMQIKLKLDEYERNVFH